MTLSNTLELDLVEATGRLAVYSLLATGFGLPTAERVDKLETSVLPAVSMLHLGEELDAMFEDVGRAFSTDVDMLRLQHSELFPPIASQDAPGYETGYRGEGVFQQSMIMADVSGFYRAQGVAAGGSEKERPDHITVELEFMAFVARKELLAIKSGQPEHAEICREMSADFLKEHLGCWGPAFGRRTEAVSSSDWFSALGRFLSRWIETDMDSFGVRPSEIFVSPLPQDPPDDGGCGACPTPGNVPT